MLVAMNVPNHHAYDTDILDTLSQRVMVGDGAIGTQLQDADLVETKYVRLQSG
jgi:5-methyltetrahydrofolate--homocysteine methyltransferase